MRCVSKRCRARRGPQIDHRQRYHGAAMGTEAVRFLVLWMAGWIHSRQLEVIDFLREENRVLREQLGGRRKATCGMRWRSMSCTITASATTKAWATGCLHQPNRWCDR